jgi:hypothetical protein
MNTITRSVLSVSLLSLVSCSSNLKYGEGSEWHQAMQVLSKTFTEFVPLLVSDEEFTKRSNREKITKLATDLSLVSHKINMSKLPPNSDPSLVFVSQRFAKEILDARDTLERGELTIARQNFRAITRYCISCHTMRESGKMPYTVELFPNLKKLSHLEKAEYYSTTRQFDQAIQHYEYALTNKSWANAHPKEWNTAFLKLMAIVIRVRKDPGLALELIGRCKETSAYPTSLAKFAKVWREHTKEWKNEKEISSADDKLAAAKKLLDRAEMSDTETARKNNLIIKIRASGYLHEYLGSSPSNANNGEAIYLAGVATEDLTELNLFTLPEDYYETCIRTNPYTDLAKNCFARLEKIADKMKTNKLLAASSPGLLGRVDELRNLAVKK